MEYYDYENYELNTGHDAEYFNRFVEAKSK